MAPMRFIGIAIASCASGLSEPRLIGAGNEAVKNGIPRFPLPRPGALRIGEFKESAQGAEVFRLVIDVIGVCLVFFGIVCLNRLPEQAQAFRVQR